MVFLNERPSDDISFGKTNVLIHVQSPLLKLSQVMLVGKHVVGKAWIGGIRKLSSKKGDYYLPKQGAQGKKLCYLVNKKGGATLWN